MNDGGVFPPTERGQWRSLDERGRRDWLRRACEHRFDKSNQQAHRVGRAGETFTIDGSAIEDLPGFFCAIGEAINGPGGYFGTSVNDFDDCLFGGFGLEAPCSVVWKHSELSKTKLGSQILANYCEDSIRWIDESEDPEDFEEGRAWRWQR